MRRMICGDRREEPRPLRRVDFWLIDNYGKRIRWMTETALTGAL